MKRFKCGDLVQLRYEYEVMGNPSLFRVRSVRKGVATLGQLSSDNPASYCGLDTTIAVDDPDLIAPHAEIVEMYFRDRCVPGQHSFAKNDCVKCGVNFYDGL